MLFGSGTRRRHLTSGADVVRVRCRLRGGGSNPWMDCSPRWRRIAPLIATERAPLQTNLSEAAAPTFYGRLTIGSTLSRFSRRTFHSDPARAGRRPPRSRQDCHRRAIGPRGCAVRFEHGLQPRRSCVANVRCNLTWLNFGVFTVARPVDQGFYRTFRLNLHTRIGS